MTIHRYTKAVLTIVAAVATFTAANAAETCVKPLQEHSGEQIVFIGNQGSDDIVILTVSKTPAGPWALYSSKANASLDEMTKAMCFVTGGTESLTLTAKP